MTLFTVNFLVVAVLILIIVSIIFVLAQLLRDNSIIDIFYGPIFFLTAFLFLVVTGTSSTLPVIIIICLGLWSMRLGGRLLIKNFGKPEDFRYAAWREAWTKKGKLYFIIRSYIQINLLQGFIILLVLLPFIISASTEQISAPLVVAGLLVFLLGFIWESVADWQLDRFIARKKAGLTNAVLMTEGLFKFSRRPNYFGESLIWWGQAIMVLSLPYGWLGLISPIVITTILVKISGPMLENDFLKRYPEEYDHYMDTTNAFIPGPKKL